MFIYVGQELFFIRFWKVTEEAVRDGIFSWG